MDAAVNLAFLGTATYLVGRDIASYLPTPQKTPAKRLRGEPSAGHEMDDTCDPAALPPRVSRGPSLAPRSRAAVKACCESLLEQKYIQEVVSGVVPSASTTPRVTCLNDLGQGTSATTRVGNKILMKYLQISGQVYLPANTQSDVYRLIVVLDHECFGSVCSYVQYIQGSGSPTVYTLPSLETVGKGKRFTTLVDKVLPLNAVEEPTASPFVFRTFSITVPLNSSAYYSGNAGTISDIVRNSLCAIECTSGGRAVCEYQARLVFLDG